MSFEFFWKLFFTVGAVILIAPILLILVGTIIGDIILEIKTIKRDWEEF